MASAAWSPRFWLGCFVVAVLLELGFAAVYPTDLPKAPPVSTVALMSLHPVDDTVQDARPDAPLPVDLYRFALNAFLVPLLDDSAPPRWTDVAMEFACGPGTTVMVDGDPMVAGQPIPVKAFTVRWMMDRCSPLGRESVELSGGVELVVRTLERFGQVGWMGFPPDRMISIQALAKMRRPSASDLGIR